MLGWGSVTGWNNQGRLGYAAVIKHPKVSET